MDRGQEGGGFGERVEVEGGGRARGGERDVTTGRTKSWDRRAGTRGQSAETEKGLRVFPIRGSVEGRRHGLDGKDEARLRRVKLMSACRSAEESPFPGAEARWEVSVSEGSKRRATSGEGRRLAVCRVREGGFRRKQMVG